MVKTGPQNSTSQNRPPRGGPPEFDDELGLLRAARRDGGAPTTGVARLAHQEDASAAGGRPALLSRAARGRPTPRSARAFDPRRQRAKPSITLTVAVSAERARRTIIASQLIDGKGVQVQRRQAFAIHIG